MINFEEMKFARQIFAFYINSSIHVALSVAALTYITILEFNLPTRWQLLVYIFLGTLTGYNFVKYAKIAGLHHRELTKALKSIQIFSALCFLLFIYFAFQIFIQVLLLTVCFGLPTFFYAVPLFRHKNLRSLAGVKIFVVALVWAGVTVVVPVAASGNVISADVVLAFFQRMLIVVVLMFPFEIRDVPYDALNLKTLPQQIGIKNTKVLGEMILMLCLILEYFKDNGEIAYLTSLTCFAVILGGMIAASKTNQNLYFSSFWVESLPIWWLFMYGLMK